MPFKNVFFLIIGSISIDLHFIYSADADVLQKAADKTDEIYHLASRYRFGLGVPESLDNYIKWMNLAAEQGHAGAQHQMSLAYWKGEGVEQSNDKAFYWCNKAAAQAHEDSIINLACMHQMGIGTPPSADEAARWLSKIDDAFVLNGFITSLFRSKFDHTPEPISVKMVETTARKGSGAACLALYHYYADTDSQTTDRNPVEAMKWLEMSAELNQKDSYYYLGFSYRFGDCVPIDKAMAHAWYNIGRTLGNGKCELEMWNTARDMSPEQVAEAEKLAREIYKRLTKKEE